MAAMFLVTMAALTAIASAAHCAENDLCDAKVGDNAVVGSSFMQASTTATISVSKDLSEDPFGELEDGFDIPALSQKAPIGFPSLDSAYQTTSFWISCSQDIFIFAFVLFVVPLIAGKLLQTTRSVKKVEEPLCVTPSKQQPRRTTVNLGALTKAARSGDEALWRSLLQAMPNPARAADNFGCTALHVAACAGCVEMAKVLLEAGADVDVKDAWEETPLHFAARKGSTETCELLVSKGAELDALNSEDVTPLVAAAKANCESACQFLLDRGATCGGLSDADVPPLLSSLLMYKMILPSSEGQAEQ